MPLLDADLSQIEWRVAAFLSQDLLMIEEVNGGIDQHAASCAELMEMVVNYENRNQAKTFNFRMIYRGSAYGYYLDPNMPNFTKKKWEGIVEEFFVKYKGLDKWHKQIIREVYRQGMLVSPTGRVFKYEKEPAKGGGMKYNTSAIVNYPVQGFAADIMHLAMVQIAMQLKKYPEIKLLMQVHDSIIIDTPKKHIDFVADTCYNIFIELPLLLNKFFGIDFNVNLSGEVDLCEGSWANAQTIRGG